MEGKYKGTFVIKPCIEGHKTFSLRTSSLEGSFTENKYDQDNPFRGRTNTMLGNMFEEIVMVSISDPDAGKFLCALYLERLNTTQMSNWVQESDGNEKSGKAGDLAYFKYKLENFVPVLIAQHYYQGKIISMQTAMSRWVECGEYLVEITGTSDLLTMSREIRDLKYYGSEFGDKYDEQYDLITMANFHDSRCRKKKQRYVYPRLLDEWDINGNIKSGYDLYKKTKNAISEKNPDNHLKRVVYNCEVNKELVEKQIRKDIINYFINCNVTSTTLGQRVDIKAALADPEMPNHELIYIP